MIDMYLIQILFPLILAILCLLVTGRQLKILSCVGALTYVVLTSFVIDKLKTISISIFFKSKEIEFESLFYNSQLLDNFEKIMIILGTFIVLLVVILSLSKQSKGRQYYFLLFVITFFGNLATCSTDLMTFYIFSEVIVIPSFILYGVYGMKSKKTSIKFLLFHLFGNILVLLSLVNIVVIVGNNNSEIVFFHEKIRNYMVENNTTVLNWFIFWPLCLSYLMKLSSFPFYLWNRELIKKAEIGSAIIICFTYFRLGSFGIKKFLMKAFAFNVEQYEEVFLFTGVFCVIYFSLKALNQKNMKDIVSNYYISSVGFIIVGFFGTVKNTLWGTSVYWISHVMVACGLMLIVDILEERYGSSLVGENKGVIYWSPFLGITIFIIIFTAIGFPLTSGFSGFYLLLTEVTEKNKILGIVCMSGVILLTLYLIKFCQNIVIGKEKNKTQVSFMELSVSEIVCFCSIMLVVFTVGLYPEILKML